METALRMRKPSKFAEILWRTVAHMCLAKPTMCPVLTLTWKVFSSASLKVLYIPFVIFENFPIMCIFASLRKPFFFSIFPLLEKSKASIMSTTLNTFKINSLKWLHLWTIIYIQILQRAFNRCFMLLHQRMLTKLRIAWTQTTVPMSNRISLLTAFITSVTPSATF